MKNKREYDPKKYISIGGVIYSRKAELNGWGIRILGYDINTERHLIVKTSFDKEKRIELDNSGLLLREWGQRNYK